MNLEVGPNVATIFAGAVTCILAYIGYLAKRTHTLVNGQMAQRVLDQRTIGRLEGIIEQLLSRAARAKFDECKTCGKLVAELDTEITIIKGRENANP
jgi:hypothetical protein